MLKNIIIFTLLFSFFPFINTGYSEEISCIIPEQCFVLSVKRYKEGETEASIRLFNYIKVKYSDTIWAYRSTFLLGKIFKELDSPESVSYLLQSIIEIPDIGDYSLYYLSEYYSEREEYTKGIRSLKTLLSLYPDSYLKKDALFISGRIYFESSDYQSAIETLDSFIKEYHEDKRVADAFLMIGKSYLEKGDKTEAIQRFRKIWWRYPESDIAEKSEQELRNMEIAGIEIPPPTLDERYQRGTNLYDLSLYNEAIEEFNILLEEAKKHNVSYQKDILLKMAVSYYRIRNLKDSKDILQQVIDDTSLKALHPEALLWMAKIYYRTEDKKGLMKTYDYMRKQYPQKPELINILNLIANLYKDKKDIDKALLYYKRIFKLADDEDFKKDALWNSGWLYYKEKKYKHAVKEWNRFMRIFPDSDVLHKILYWKGRALENLKDRENAIKAYQMVCDRFSNTYYCHNSMIRANKINAENQLKEKPHFKEGGDEKNNFEDDLFSKDRAYRKARELIILGMEKEAITELNIIIKGYIRDRNNMLILNRILYKLGNYYNSLRNIRLYFQDILINGDNISFEFWEQAYPLGLSEIIDRYALEDKMDSYLISALIREESSFDPHAVSRVGALGLMQVMPFTGEKVAKEIGIDFNSKDLFEPEINIRIGVKYVASLYEKYDKNIIYTIAAYNAGDRAVDRWIKSEGDLELDEFVESISYKETRFFVKRVMRSYEEYKQIAEEMKMVRFKD
ncbi:MAG: tetratricopeptide repeat protein [Nitrospirota bacterium]